MLSENKTTNRYDDIPRDRPRREGCEHANHERPGAQAHPRATGWERPVLDPRAAWRLN